MSREKYDKIRRKIPNKNGKKGVTKHGVEDGTETVSEGR